MNRGLEEENQMYSTLCERQKSEILVEKMTLCSLHKIRYLNTMPEPDTNKPSMIHLPAISVWYHLLSSPSKQHL